MFVSIVVVHDRLNSFGEEDEIDCTEAQLGQNQQEVHYCLTPVAVTT